MRNIKDKDLYNEFLAAMADGLTVTAAKNMVMSDYSIGWYRISMVVDMAESEK
tara:strand:+ start:5007 stop:5165 length:159 start_codon:yes stop_codon:yes gene_type:complete